MRASLQGRDVGIEVITLGGVRGQEFGEKLCGFLRSTESFTIALLGREEVRYVGVCETSPTSALVRMRKRNVRNARLSEIIDFIDRGRAVIRNRVLWSRESGAYLLNRGEGQELGFSYEDPATDVFFLFGERALRKLAFLVEKELRTPPFTVRLRGGYHALFIGHYKVAELVFDDYGIIPSVIHVDERIDEASRMFKHQLENTLKANEGIIKDIERISIDFLKKHVNEETVVVPWSGGKDSTVALVLALKAFGNEKVVAVYVDTGVDFPMNADYVKELADRLGIELLYVRAPVLDELEAGRAFPTHEDRWCTVLKTEYLYKEILGKYGTNVAIITGDRDAESRSRALKPFIEWKHGLRHIYPIKMWSTLHVQAYLSLNRIPINTLYDVGFYRIGCYVCPSLRSWEKFMILTDLEVVKSIRRRDFLRKLLQQ